MKVNSTHCVPLASEQLILRFSSHWEAGSRDKEAFSTLIVDTTSTLFHPLVVHIRKQKGETMPRVIKLISGRAQT